MNTARILVVEDDESIQELVRYNLTREGYIVETASTGEIGLNLARSIQPDLVVLDLMLPGIDGVEVCRQLKGEPQTDGISILMLTAKGEEQDEVHGLTIGADEFMHKPFRPQVLVARVKNLLRRKAAEELRQSEAYDSGSQHAMEARPMMGGAGHPPFGGPRHPTPPPYSQTRPPSETGMPGRKTTNESSTYGADAEFEDADNTDTIVAPSTATDGTPDLVIHPGRFEVLVRGEPVKLTLTEFRVLHFLARRPGWVFSRYQIVNAVKGPDYPVTERSVDVQIVGLRRKLGKDVGAYIETVRGVGYRFKETTQDN